MSKWNVVDLPDVCVLNPAWLVETINPDEEISFVPMSAVSSETASISEAEPRLLGDVLQGYTTFSNGDVLLAKITPCFENGKIAHVRIKHRYGFGSTEFHVLRTCADLLDSRYLLHFLRQDRIRKDGARKMTGSAGQRRVPKHFLESLKIPLPPLPEQRRIADVLDRAEALRAKRRAALAQLDTLTQAIFHEMFGDPVTNPRKWNRAHLGDVLTKIESGWSPICLDRPIVGDEWGVLKLGAVTWCEYNSADNKALPPEVEPDPSLEVKKGDLLFTRKNTYELVAACVFVRETPKRLLMSDLIFRLCLRPDAAIDLQFLQQLLINPGKRREIQKLAGGSAGSMPNISKARLLTASIEIPPLSLQQEFARRVEVIEQLRSAHRASLVQMDELFASLQHRAFRGEL